jgi:hypothetical protein
MSTSNTTTDASSINAISALRKNGILFIQIWSSIIFPLGFVGHVLSIYVFTRPTLRSNPCSQYFLASAISGMGIMCVNIPLRLLQQVYGIDVFVYSDAACRIIQWILLTIRYKESLTQENGIIRNIVLEPYLRGLLYLLVLIG